MLSLEVAKYSPRLFTHVGSLTASVLTLYSRKIQSGQQKTKPTSRAALARKPLLQRLHLQFPSRICSGRSGAAALPLALHQFIQLCMGHGLIWHKYLFSAYDEGSKHEASTNKLSPSQRYWNKRFLCRTNTKILRLHLHARNLQFQLQWCIISNATHRTTEISILSCLAVRFFGGYLSSLNRRPSRSILRYVLFSVWSTFGRSIWVIEP